MEKHSYLTADDIALVDACISQNRVAQRTLYKRYCDAMFTLAVRMVGNNLEAEEVLQDAFLNVFSNLATFRRESSLGAWIKTIVIRCALRFIRKRKEWSFSDLSDENIGETLDWGRRSIDVEYLEKVILSLPTGYRTVFVLIEIEGYSHQEVAEMLGIGVGTSKSQLFNAKKQLKKELDNYR